MNKKELIAELAKLDMRPGRGLGQNFLLDNNLLDFIVRTADVKEGENILEVGPGFGALTAKLLDTGAKVTAIEFDRRLAEYLRNKFQNHTLRIVEKDACKVDYDSLFPDGTPFRSVANLPYAVSSVFIAKLLGGVNRPQEMFFMLQKEMGERLAAKPGCKAYGALSVQCQLFYDVEIVRIVPPEVFFPAPEVDSAIVAFKRHDKFDIAPGFWRTLSGIVKLSFSQRRKQMGKVLSRGGYDPERVKNAFDQCALDMEIRPDRVDAATFYKLANLITIKDLS